MILRLYITIGRANPPQIGHVHLFQEIIKKAGDNALTLIILGSGPKQKGTDDRRTMSDPIGFGLKKQILESKITGNYAIIEKSDQNPADIIADFAKSRGATEVEFKYFAGSKDEDLGKILNWLPGAIVTSLNKRDITKITSLGGESIEAFKQDEITTSATAVRQSIYLSENYDEWRKTQFHDFYGIFARDVYNEIKEIQEQPKPPKVIKLKRSKSQTLFESKMVAQPPRAKTHAENKSARKKSLRSLIKGKKKSESAGGKTKKKHHKGATAKRCSSNKM